MSTQKQKETPWLKGRTIMLIEDDHFISKVYAKWFQLSGAQVLIAHNGALGLGMLKEHAVDIILLDLGMPGLNGYETLTMLRGDDTTADIPVIILSNTTVSKDAKEYREIQSAGVKYILRKYETSLSEILAHMKEYFDTDPVTH